MYKFKLYHYLENMFCKLKWIWKNFGLFWFTVRKFICWSSQPRWEMKIPNKLLVRCFVTIGKMENHPESYN